MKKKHISRKELAKRARALIGRQVYFKSSKKEKEDLKEYRLTPDRLYTITDVSLFHLRYKPYIVKIFDNKGVSCSILLYGSKEGRGCAYLKYAGVKKPHWIVKKKGSKKS